MSIIGKIIDLILVGKDDPPPPKSAKQIRDYSIAADLLKSLKKKIYRNLRVEGDFIKISSDQGEFSMKYGIYPGPFRIYFTELNIKSRVQDPILDITGKILFDIEKEVTKIIKKDKSLKVK